MPKTLSNGSADPFELEHVNFAIKELYRLLVELGPERRLYRRYLGEARARRHLRSGARLIGPKTQISESN